MTVDPPYVMERRYHVNDSLLWRSRSLFPKFCKGEFEFIDQTFVVSKIGENLFTPHIPQLKIDEITISDLGSKQADNLTSDVGHIDDLAPNDLVILTDDE